ncbi:MAG: hypothetical protein AB7L09_00010 [Nitrospira sp.]
MAAVDLACDCGLICFQISPRPGQSRKHLIAAWQAHLTTHDYDIRCNCGRTYKIVPAGNGIKLDETK